MEGTSLSKSNSLLFFSTSNSTQSIALKLKATQQAMNNDAEMSYLSAQLASEFDALRDLFDELDIDLREKFARKFAKVKEKISAFITNKTMKHVKEARRAVKKLKFKVKKRQLMAIAKPVFYANKGTDDRRLHPSQLFRRILGR